MNLYFADILCGVRFFLVLKELEIVHGNWTYISAVASFSLVALLVFFADITGVSHNHTRAKLFCCYSSASKCMSIAGITGSTLSGS